MHSLKKVSRFIFLLVIISMSSRAQDVAETLNYAHYLFKIGEHKRALVNYQRVLYFSPKDINTACLVRMGDCYCALDSLHKANAYYDLAFFSTSSDSIKDALLLKRIENLIISKEYMLALQDLYAVEVNTPSKSRQVTLYTACIYYGLNDFKQAEHYFSILLDSTRAPMLHKQYLNILKELDHVNRLNPNTAMILSMIIPGTGQFYAGDIKNGLNSLTITSLFLYFTTRSIITVGVLEGFTTVFPIYFRYYTGGFKRAKAIAQQRKEYRRAEIYNKLLSLYADYERIHP